MGGVPPSLTKKNLVGSFDGLPIIPDLFLYSGLFLFLLSFALMELSNGTSELDVSRSNAD